MHPDISVPFISVMTYREAAHREEYACRTNNVGRSGHLCPQPTACDNQPSPVLASAQGVGVRNDHCPPPQWLSSAIPPPDNREPHNPRKWHRKTLSPVPQLRGTRLNIIELTSAAQDDRLSPRRHPDHSRRRFRRAVRQRSGPERRSAGHDRRRPSGRR